MLKSKEEYFRRHVVRLVEEAVARIQKVVKGRLTRARFRRILQKERDYPSVRWKFAGKTVYVIGEMTRPHWVRKIKLKWCPLRGIYVKYFKTPLDPSRLCRYLFVVDGKYCFDATLPCTGGGTRYTTNYMLPKFACPTLGCKH